MELITHTSSRKRIFIAFVLGLVYVSLLVIGAHMSGSLAMLANAGHMITHTGVLFIALIASSIALKAPDARFPYGYGKVETLGGYTNGLLLMATALYIGVEALSRSHTDHGVHSHADLNTSLMGQIAIAGLVLHAISAWVLYGGRKQSLNVYAAFLHIFFDVLATLLMLAASVIIHMTGFERIDIAVGLIIAVLIFISSVKILWQSTLQLIDAAPKHIDYDAVTASLLSIPHVCDVHELHIRTREGGQLQLSAHMVMKKACVHAEHWDECRREAEKRLRENFGITYSILQLEAEETHNH